jgi:hypothetical protein
MPVDVRSVTRWFAQYLDTYGACGRGDCEISELLGYYGVPLLLTSDDGFVALETAEQVAAAMQGQLDGLRGAGYHHSEVVHEEVTVLNLASALYQGGFARVRRDGGEIARVVVTYLATDGPDGLRISVLAAHSR